MFGSQTRQYKSIRYEKRRTFRSDRDKMPPAEMQAELDAYDESIAYLDHQLGLLFDELARRGVLDNTIVIITSDHGEQFGEHRPLSAWQQPLYAIATCAASDKTTLACLRGRHGN